MIDRTTAETSTIWMNVTTSANWDRPAVGIVRVEQQLFQALQNRLGNRLQACIVSDGKFVHYDGLVGTVKAAAADHLIDDSFIWPDPSFGAPAEPVGAPVRQRQSRPARQRRRPSLDGVRPVEFSFGDTLVSVGLDWEWETKRLDLLMHSLKTKQGVNVISCCYDLIPILFPQYCVGDVVGKFQEYFTNLSWASSGMLCISKQTQTDYLALAHRLGMPPIPTKVMLLGNTLPDRGEDLSEKVRQLSEQRFILFVGTIERRKNHEVLYKALHLLAEQGRLPADLKLVFVGMPGWGVGDLLKDIELDPLTTGHIVQVHHANDADLRRLYERCEFAVYPSLYEGWGLPVAEALALGKFVLASDRGSIPEIAGGLIDYVDPWNASAWAHAITRYWNDPALLAQRSEQVKADYQPISWNEAASAVLDLAAQLAHERPGPIAIQPGYDMLTESGVRYGGRIVSTGSVGLFCFGPYIPLPAGSFAVEVEIEVPTSTELDLVFLFSVGHGETMLKEERMRLTAAAGPRVLRFELDIDRPVDDFELVIEDHAGDIFSLNAVTVRPL